MMFGKGRLSSLELPLELEILLPGSRERRKELADRVADTVARCAVMPPCIACDSCMSNYEGVCFCRRHAEFDQVTGSMSYKTCRASRSDDRCSFSFAATAEALCSPKGDMAVRIGRALAGMLAAALALLVFQLAVPGFPYRSLLWVVDAIAGGSAFALFVVYQGRIYDTAWRARRVEEWYDRFIVRHLDVPDFDYDGVEPDEAEGKARQDTGAMFDRRLIPSLLEKEQSGR